MADQETPAEARERRRFTRVTFVDMAKLFQGDHLWIVDILDLSLKGAMVTKPVHWSLDPAKPCRLEIHLNRDKAMIDMRTRVAYEGGRRLGLEWVELDLDSLAHLRRVLEANSGDLGIPERELSELIEAGSGMAPDTTT